MNLVAWRVVRMHGGNILSKRISCRAAPTATALRTRPFSLRERR
jgi:hypothetical protein